MILIYFSFFYNDLICAILKGDRGPNGVVGRAGVFGKDGENGLDGLQGSPGIPGPKVKKPCYILHHTQITLIQTASFWQK